MMSLHKRISFTKSTVRIMSCMVGWFAIPTPLGHVAFLLLGLSEVIGVIEEFWES